MANMSMLPYQLGPATVHVTAYYFACPRDVYDALPWDETEHGGTVWKQRTFEGTNGVQSRDIAYRRDPAIAASSAVA